MADLFSKYPVVMIILDLIITAVYCVNYYYDSLVFKMLFSLSES